MFEVIIKNKENRVFDIIELYGWDAVYEYTDEFFDSFNYDDSVVKNFEVIVRKM